MSTTILGHPLYYPDYTTSIPSPKTYQPYPKSYGKGLRLSTPFSHREWVDQHTSRCSPPELPFTDSPLSDPILWAWTEDARSVSRLSLREARARQATCLEAEAISTGTATHSEHLPAPLNSRVPRPLLAPLPATPGSPDPLVPLVVTHLQVSTIHIELQSVTHSLDKRRNLHWGQGNMPLQQ